MLAERLPSVMPLLEPAAALEVSAIHSVAGSLPAGRPLVRVPPFCAPHHTATKAAIVGGGSGVIRPGARGADRIIRMAWTPADLAAVPRPGKPEIGHALALWRGVSL